MGRLFVGSFFFLRKSPTMEAVESEKKEISKERKPNPKHVPPPKKPTRKQIKKAKQQANKEVKLAEQKAKENRHLQLSIK